MKELLTCAQCEKRWRREKTRGRKPTICPKCTKAALKQSAAPKKKTPVQVQEVKPVKKRAKRKVVATPKKAVASSAKKDIEESNDPEELTVGKVYSMMHPRPSNSDDLRTSTKGGSTWRCTSCRKTFKLLLPVTAPPTHQCSPSSKSKPCERVK